MISASFLMIYVSVSVTSFLTSEVMDQLDYGNFGYILLSFEYLAFCLGCFIASPLSNRYGARRTIPFGSLLNATYTASFIIPVVCDIDKTTTGICNKSVAGTILSISAFLGGIGLAILWVSNGSYIGECSTEATVNSNQGLFFSVFSFNAIIGNLIGMALLKTEGLRVVLYILMTVMCINASLLQIFLPTTPVECEALQRQANGEPKPQLKPFWENVKTEVKLTWNLVISKRFAPFFLYSVYNGAELSYYMGVLPDLAGESVFREKNKDKWTDEDELECNYKTCLAMLGVGFGQCLSAWLSGRIGAKLGKRSTMHLNFILSVIAIVSAFIVTSSCRSVYNAAWFVTAFLWGCQDACLDVSNNAIAVSEFGNPAEGAAAYSSVQTMSAFLVFFISTWLTVWHPAWILGILAVNLILAYLTSFKMKFNQESKPKEEKLAISPVEEGPKDEPLSEEPKAEAKVESVNDSSIKDEVETSAL